jgi:hypothetical protein
MSRPGARNAVAGLALAAVGLLFRRRRASDAPKALPAPAPKPEPSPDSVAQPDSAEVERARGELADELARRARTEP